MSTYVGRVGSCCNNYNTQSNMFIGPYLVQDMNASALKPRIKPYSGWASYKNVISGQYNRQLCWNCADFKGYPQTAGVYDLNIVVNKYETENNIDKTITTIQNQIFKIPDLLVQINQMKNYNLF